MGDSLLTKLLVRTPWVGPRAVYRLQAAGTGYPALDWPELARAVTRDGPDVLSVDVFDTSIVRRLVGDAVVEHAIGHLAGRTSTAIEATAAELERVLVRPVPGAAESLAAIRKADTDVVFVSDTDRSSDLLIEILRSWGLFVDGDRLIASCEAGKTKSDGALFHTIVTPADDAGRSIWHVGNHLWADVAMAATSGLTPIPIVQADANRYERAMAVGQTGLGPAVAGAARLARLDIGADHRAGLIDEHQARIQEVGADVAGPAMTAFVLWVSEQCRAEKIDHIGFLARDGELPLRVAEAIPADHWDGRSLRYLHCSRLTWSLAAASVLGIERWLHDGTKDDDAFLHAKRHQVPLEALLARIGLGPADLTGEPRHRWLAGLSPDEALPEFAVEDWEGLLADPAVHETIAARADERLKLIVDRLRADGTPAGKFGLVDVGWRGRLASHVSAVLAQVVGQEPVHFHFGGHKVLPDVDAIVSIKRFAFAGTSEPHRIEAPVSCIETLTASGKPRVIDYRRDANGEVELVFDKPDGGPDGDREDLWAGAIRMARLVPSRSDLERWGLDPASLAPEARAVLDLWWNKPTTEEVRAFQDLRFEHDEAGTHFRPVVSPYRFSELRRTGEPIPRQWPQGSVVLSGTVMARIVRVVWRIRRLRRRFPD